jgi:hypothetical protein
MDIKSCDGCRHYLPDKYNYQCWDCERRENRGDIRDKYELTKLTNNDTVEQKNKINGQNDKITL